MQYGNVIGVGNTAIVYEWEEGKVLKLFYPVYPNEAVEREFYNAKAISNMGFAKPKVYEIIDCQGQMGIIYDRVRGESLLDWVMKTGDVQGCAKYMAELHKEILGNSINNVPNYKEFLKYFILKTLPTNPEKAKEALQVLEKLPEGNTLCHGDFHPGNIFISDGHAAVIDFMNVCKGDFLYDVARTIFLVEYTPVPMEAENKEMITQLKKTLADLYLMEMNITRERIKDYLLVIIAARVGECPKE
jgi:uncharacterized protein (TIGR02172 family)